MTCLNCKSADHNYSDCNFATIRQKERIIQISKRKGKKLNWNDLQKVTKKQASKIISNWYSNHNTTGWDHLLQRSN